MIWLNVDKPTKLCTLHTDGRCTKWQKNRETQFKGLGKLKYNGGWLNFVSAEQAMLYYQSDFPEYEFIDHC